VLVIYNINNKMWWLTYNINNKMWWLTYNINNKMWWLIYNINNKMWWLTYNINNKMWWLIYNINKNKSLLSCCCWCSTSITEIIMTLLSGNLALEHLPGGVTSEVIMNTWWSTKYIFLLPVQHITIHVIH
jgi:hypothetical protein